MLYPPRFPKPTWLHTAAGIIAAAFLTVSAPPAWAWASTTAQALGERLERLEAPARITITVETR